MKYKIEINGSLWVNHAKYEYVDSIELTEENLIINNRGREIGHIKRKNIKTLIEENEKGLVTDMVDNLIYLFDIRKTGDM